MSERTGPHLSLPVRRSVPSLFSSWMMAFLGFTTNRYRRQTFMYSRLYRFVVNPRKAIIQELERLGTDLLTGRER